MREETLAQIKRGYEAFAKGDLDTIRAMGAVDEVWYTACPTFEPEYKGIESIIGYLVSLATLTDATFKVEPEMFFAEEDRVVVLERITATRKGRMLDTPFVHIYEVLAGKVTRVTEFAAEPKKLEEFWA